MLSVPDQRGYDWSEGSLDFEQVVTFHAKTVGKHTLVHITGQSKPSTLGLTKLELKRLMEGYPPFYREKVVTSYGPQFEFPISRPNDVRRGAWIVAVGFMDNRLRNGMSLYCIPFQSDSQPDGLYAGRQNGTVFRGAIARLAETLRSIRSRLSDVEAVDLNMVVKAVEYMVASGTGSGVEKFLPGRVVREPAALRVVLTKRQLEEVLDIFKEVYPTDEQVDVLRPLLKPVLQAVFNGTYTIVQYLKDTGFRLAMPEELRGPNDMPVYLVDCVK